MKFYLTKAAQRQAESGEPRSQDGARARASTAPAALDESSRRARSRRSVGQAPAPTATAASAPAAPPPPISRSKPAKGVIAIGGVPRVDLLPPEVRAERHAAVNVRRAWTGVVGLVVIVGVAGATAAIYASAATATLASSQKETSSLIMQSAGFSEVNTVQNETDLVGAAVRVGGSTDIDWPSYLAKVKATVPNGMELATVTIDSATPVVAYAQATTPLEGQRVATLTFSSTSSSLPDVPTWLTSLRTLPGYTDASAGTVALSAGVYTSNVVVHVDSEAFSKAYSKEGK